MTKYTFQFMNEVNNGNVIFYETNYLPGNIEEDIIESFKETIKELEARYFYMAGKSEPNKGDYVNPSIFDLEGYIPEEYIKTLNSDSRIIKRSRFKIEYKTYFKNHIQLTII